jgi:nucleoid DNA-binding protein
MKKKDNITSPKFNNSIEKEEVEAKSIENMLNTIIAEYAPNLEKGMVVQVQNFYHFTQTRPEKNLSKACYS